LDLIHNIPNFYGSLKIGCLICLSCFQASKAIFQTQHCKVEYFDDSFISWKKKKKKKKGKWVFVLDSNFDNRLIIYQAQELTSSNGV
jgi:hypothetical protein